MRCVLTPYREYDIYAGQLARTFSLNYDGRNVDDRAAHVAHFTAAFYSDIVAPTPGGHKMVALVRRNVRNVTVLALLCALAVTLAGFSGSPQGSTGTFTAPTDVLATSADGTITVSWTPGSGAASQVIVVVNVLDDTDYCLEVDFTGTANSYQCAGRTEGATYVVLVIALDGQGGYAIGRDAGGRLVTHTVPAMMADAAVLAAEKGVLMALYNGTGGANWTDNTNWLSDASIDVWYGVVTDTSGRVTELNLDDNRLTGRIPLALGNLWSLTNLHLHRNQLSGPIPDTLGNLSNLEVLSLGGNQFTGTIPSSLSRLSNLTEMYIWGSELPGPVPSWLGSLTNLEMINLSDNQLTGPIPSNLGNLSSLTVLRLHRNQLSGPIPDTLGNLTNLKELYLQDNQLTGTIPSQLQNLRNLKHLSLGTNQLTGTIPTWIGDLSELERLSLTSNQLTGTIPAQLGNLANLQRLSLSRNQLTGSIPSSLGNLTEMGQLLLYDNQLSGQIPASLSNLTKLTILRLVGTNQFTGCIPAGLSDVADNDLGDLGLPDC